MCQEFLSHARSSTTDTGIFRNTGLVQAWYTVQGEKFSLLICSTDAHQKAPVFELLSYPGHQSSILLKVVINQGFIAIKV